MGRIKDAALQTNPYQPSSIIHNFWCRNNCHRHALSVQLLQTHLSFDIWLMLSRGTAAGHRKQRTGKTVAAWVVSDSSSCCASISPFRIRVFPWPKTLRPHQMQIDLMFIHRKSYKSVKMCNSSSELSCIICMRILRMKFVWLSEMIMVCFQCKQKMEYGGNVLQIIYYFRNYQRISRKAKSFLQIR